MHGEEQLRDFLLDSGLVSRSQLDAALREVNGQELPRFLVERGLLSEDEMRRALAHALGVPFVVLEVDDITPEALELIPEALARSQNIVAYNMKDDAVQVALLTLDNLRAVEFLRAKMKVLPRLTNRDSVRRALLVYQKQLKKKFGEAISRDVQAVIEPAPGASEELLHYSAERLPVVYVTDALVRHALNQKASHVHLETGEAGLVVRYRIGGVLHDAMTLPRHAAGPVMLRLKLLANLPLKTTTPQEGRFKIKIEEEVHAVRVSTLPTIGGEKLVLRIVSDYSRARGFTLESLGFHGEALEEVHAALLARRGLVVVCGPEQSGKTTTLYTLLDLMQNPNLSIVTVEDSLEVLLPYASQIKTDSLVGFTTSAALRAALKLDPDVVMIGEAHEREISALLVSAAARGVLVLAGVQDEMKFAESANLLIRVRRARRLCTRSQSVMKKLSRAEANTLEEAGADFTKLLSALKEEKIIDKEAQWKDVLFAHAEPCGGCDGGYMGYVGLQEVVGGEQGLSLLEDGLFKAAAGQTSVEEVLNLLR